MEQVALLGRERAPFAASCTPKSLRLLNLSCRAPVYESVGQWLESSLAHHHVGFLPRQPMPNDSLL